MPGETREEREIEGWKCVAVRSRYGQLPYVRITGQVWWREFEFTLDVHRDGNVDIHNADFADVDRFCRLLPRLAEWGRELLLEER